MQSETEKDQILVVAHQGFDQEGRRAYVKVLGSIDRLSLVPSEGLIENLTDNAKKELQAHIEELQQMAINQNRLRNISLHDMNRIARHIAEATAMIDGSVSASDAVEIWHSIDLLGRTLRRAGHLRPPRQVVAVAVSNDWQLSPPEAT